MTHFRLEATQVESIVPPGKQNVREIVAIMQQGITAEETEKRRLRERAKHRKARKRAHLKRHRLVPEEDTLYELPVNARMPEIDYNTVIQQREAELMT
ncbi:hypothetical protein L596_010759 [Steinernema carpocapsae]|uniref:Uncharacterized protein n=1 Tax=Steinernema carpocapsae TaxID=34508 RepID=A0A4U5PJH2_STECR|nr:hypothetical protein L596_010759 [Steinernema carpocapsae]